MRALLTTIEGLSPDDDPYDLAQTAVSYLRSPSAFTYSTDVTDLDCGDRSIAECFAHFKRGYCQYYATTMTMLMRMAGVPARYVQGFLPGRPRRQRRRDDPLQQLPRLGRGVLPGLRLGHVRSDGRRGGPADVAAGGPGRPVGEAHACVVADRRRRGARPAPGAPPGGDIVPQSSGGIITPGGTLVIFA